MNQADLYTFMSQQRYGVVSSTGPDGLPQSALVGISTTPQLEIVFDTSKNSRKFRNLTDRPDCSLVVGWTDEKTVQFEGRASLPDEQDLERLQRIYFSIWPDGKPRSSSKDIAFVLVRPRWIRYSDYSGSLPLIEEMTFDVIGDRRQ